MKEFSPGYYDGFRCIADRCIHNCCIGWEVDIDAPTLEKYVSLKNPLGDRIRKGIREEDGVTFFSMDEKGRCPMLRNGGLCEIICEKGEEYLCEICREHPRFYNFFSDRTECGLGLCCEEAARLIISQKKPFELIVRSDDGSNEENSDFENYIIFMRDECIKLLEDDTAPLSERLDNVLSFCEAEKPDLDNDDIFRLYASLERLDGEWEKSLYRLREASGRLPAELIDSEEYTLFFKNLAVYFIYRQFTASVYDMMISERALFMSLSLTVIAAICCDILDEKGCLAFSDICETARAYCAETEYSEENMETLLSALQSKS